jgi:hypothetical protein
MSHVLKSADAHKIVFQRASEGCSTAVFVIVGSVFTLIGVAINLLSTDMEFPFLLFKILFPVFGVGAIAAGIAAPKIAKRTIPELISFRNDQGAVVVEMDSSTRQTSHIRYDEIEKFDIYVESRSSSSSSSRPSRIVYYYHVLLRKKDGGEWFITECNSQKQAEEIIQQLTTGVKLTNPCTLSNNQTLTSKLSKQEGIDKTVIHWQNKVGFFAPVFLIFFSIAFLSILSTAFTSTFDLNGFVYFVIGFMLLVFSLVMFVTIKNMIKEATTRYAISIDRSALEYYEFSKSSGIMKNKKSIPLTEVHSIVYSFAPIKNYSNSGLTISTEKETLQAKENKDKPLTGLKNLFSGKGQPINLSITALNPVECLQLESWLQDLIKKKGNLHVI